MSTTPRSQTARKLGPELAKSGRPSPGPAISEEVSRSRVAVLLLDAMGVLVGVHGRVAMEAEDSLGPLVGRSAFDFAEGARFVSDAEAPCSGATALRRALAGEELEGIAYAADRVFEARLGTRSDGTPGACVVALEVTRRHAAQARAIREDRLLALGRLAAGVASEINNPLTYVLINVDHVMRRLRSLGAIAASEAPPWSELSAAFAGFVDALAKASEGANRVGAITRDILVFAQGDGAPRGLVDVRAVLESSLQVAWHELRHRARVVRHLFEVPPLEANATPLAHVFLHLFVNAAHSIPEGNAEHEEIHVGTRCDDNGDVVVEIRDTGAGIPAHALPHVFEPFFTTRGVGDGMGLGLSICHGIVEHLGGSLTAESRPGEGSLFRVVLPASRAWSSGAFPAQGARPRRVLVVDADPLVGDAIARALGEGNELTTETDARRAIQLLLEADFDVVLCDVMLREASGVDFYVELLRVAPELVPRIVFMAGGATTKGLRAFLSSMTNTYLEKPLDMNRLRRLVNRAGLPE